MMINDAPMRMIKAMVRPDGSVFPPVVGNCAVVPVG
jgi:hypothetical protein